MIQRLDQYFHVSEKKTVLLFALLIVNVLSAILIQLISMLTQGSTEFWMVMIGGYLGYFCYFMMLAVYVSAIKADHSLKMNEMGSIAFKSILLSFVFYSCSSILSYSSFNMLISGSSSMILMGINLLIMLFILFYIPYSLICLFLLDTSKNPLLIMWQSAFVLIRHARECLSIVCVFALLEGCFIGISNLLFHTAMDFNPLVYVTSILTRCNPWASSISTDPFILLIFTIIYGILFTFVFFYGLYAVKEIIEN